MHTHTHTALWTLSSPLSKQMMILGLALISDTQLLNMQTEWLEPDDSAAPLFLCRCARAVLVYLLHSQLYTPSHESHGFTEVA